MRKAFTLPELVLVLAVAGILLSIAVPRFGRVLDHLSVNAAVSHIIAAHQRARIMAIARGQVLVLSVDSAALRIAPRSGGLPIWSGAGPAANRVVLAGPARQFTFSPEGITFGLSNATLQLARGSSSRRVVISRLGRVRIMPGP
jgi:prepilin-type N-terminal cleavage/methylation domain-containing protein